MFVALLALTAGLTACGGSEDTGQSSSGQPKKGGMLVVCSQDQPATLDPALNWGTGFDLEYCIFSRLLDFASGSGEKGNQLVPDMAASMPEVKNDGLSYVFHLRTGVSFAPPVDREITAADFKYSFERMMGLKAAPATYLYTSIVGAQEFVDGKAKHIEGYRVVDDQTIRIDLETTNPAILYVLALPFAAVVPKEAVDEWGEDFGHHPSGSGPFMFESWEDGQTIVLKRNPNYREADEVYLDGVREEYSVAPSTAVLRVQRGEADVAADSLPAPDYQRLMADPQWKNQVTAEPVMTLFQLFMNTKMEPFDDLRVRQAVEMAVNRAKIVKLLGGQGQSLDQVYPTGILGHQEGASFYDYDPAKAKELLAEAGYPDGFKTELMGLNIEPLPKVLQSIQYDLQQVGIKASVRVMSGQTYYSVVGKPGEVPLGIMDWWLDYPDPSNVVAALFSKASAAGGGCNGSFWWNAEVEEMTERANLETDTAKRGAIYSQMQEVIMREAPAVPLFQMVKVNVHGKGVHGFYTNSRGGFPYNEFWKDE